MGVAQARHQRQALEVDAPRRAGLDREVGNLLDPAVLDQDVAFAPGPGADIEDAGILQQHGTLYELRVFFTTTPSLTITARWAPSSCSRWRASSGLPSTASRSAKAPGATTPSRPSWPRISAPISVALRMISAGLSTWARMANSPDWWTCSSPKRSVPNAIFTPAARAISSERVPTDSTFFSFCSPSSGNPSEAPCSASAK